jgi:hypothetical protein
MDSSRTVLRLSQSGTLSVCLCVCVCVLVHLPTLRDQLNRSRFNATYAALIRAERQAAVLQGTHGETYNRVTTV